VSDAQQFELKIWADAEVTHAEPEPTTDEADEEAPKIEEPKWPLDSTQ